MAKQLTGTVTSIKMNKTIVVFVERKFRHPRFKKIIKKHAKFKAHNEDQTIKVGDVVTIQETRPISKEKHFIVAGQTVSKSTAPVAEVKEAVKKKPAVTSAKAQGVKPKVKATKAKPVKK